MLGGSKGDGSRWERSLAALAGYLRVPAAIHGDPGYDLETTDGRHILALKSSLQSVRDLNATLVQLASLLSRNPSVGHATLIARFPKMNARRVREEWEHGLELIRPELAERVGLVALAAGTDFCAPDTLELRRLKVLAREALREQPQAPSSDPTVGPWSPKQFDVWMVLLEAWLRAERPLTIKDVLMRSGVSTATVKVTFDRLHARGELVRTSDRRAVLAAFPRRSLGEILTISDGLRHTLRFVDGSGRAPDPGGLLRRLESKAPREICLGGVAGARHYTPDFDLEGLPRIDLSVPVQDPLDWLRAVEPALRRAPDHEVSPLLVIHQIARRESGAMPPGAAHRLSIAGRAEILLDLYELRLTNQADDFVRDLHREGAV